MCFQKSRIPRPGGLGFGLIGAVDETKMKHLFKKDKTSLLFLIDSGEYNVLHEIRMFRNVYLFFVLPQTKMQFTSLKRIMPLGSGIKIGKRILRYHLNQS